MCFIGRFLMNLYSMNIQCLMEEETFLKEYEKASVLRKRKIDALNVNAEKIRSLAADMLIRRGVHDYETSLQLEHQPFLSEGYGTYGKPYLQQYPNLFFNVSHSGEYVVAVFSEEEIGIDLQINKVITDHFSKRFFSEEEQKYLVELTKNDEKKDLVHPGILLWTCKESFVKYTGEGLQRSLDSFTVNIEKGIITDAFSENLLAHCIVLDSNKMGLEEDYICSVSRKTSFSNTDFRIIQIN